MAKLYFRYGVMGSSKSANALMVRYNYEERGQKALMVKPDIDQREGKAIVNSRTGRTFLAIKGDSIAAEAMGINLFRYKLLAKKSPSMFTPEEAVQRALQKFTPEDPPFTLPDIYEDAWFDLAPRMTGVFGKRFFNHVATLDSIQFAGMTSDGRRATYRITKQ